MIEQDILINYPEWWRLSKFNFPFKGLTCLTIFWLHTESTSILFCCITLKFVLASHGHFFHIHPSDSSVSDYNTKRIINKFTQVKSSVYVQVPKYLVKSSHLLSCKIQTKYCYNVPELTWKLTGHSFADQVRSSNNLHFL